MKDGLIFANARAKGKEGNLLSKERLMRMTEAKNLSDAMRILLEVNYAAEFIPEKEDFYSLLEEEERLTAAFVREAAPKESGIECYFLRNDYHNLKVLFKQKYANLIDIDSLVLPDGNYTFGYLKERFDQNKTDFSPYVEKACEQINKAFEVGNGTPRLIDVVLDKALYDDINSRLGKNADKYIKQYFRANADLTNVLSYLRAEKIGAGGNFFAEGFIEGGSITEKEFLGFSGDKNKLSNYLEGSYLKEFADKVSSDDFAAYETAQDEYLLKIFSVNKTDMFSVAPILGYYLAKLNEIKVIRVVLVCIKNGVPEDQMKKRVRELYA